MKTLVALLTLAGTGAFADELAGHYVLYGVHEVGSELLLKPDGTFEYMLAYGAADYSATGKWRREGDAVILNSVVKNDPPFRLIRSAVVKTQGICVWVKAPNGGPVPNIEVALEPSGEKADQRTDQQGAARFPDVRSANSVVFGVRVYHLKAGPYALNPAQNDFTFEINGEAITTVPFKDERLKINGKDLELRYWDENKAMNYRKE